jgi:hypothetical protein
VDAYSYVCDITLYKYKQTIYGHAAILKQWESTAPKSRVKLEDPISNPKLQLFHVNVIKI